MGLIIYFSFLKSKNEFTRLQEQELGSLSKARTAVLQFSLGFPVLVLAMVNGSNNLFLFFKK